MARIVCSNSLSSSQPRRSARQHCADVIDIISWREIFDYMEDCADACEHVGNYVEYDFNFGEDEEIEWSVDK